MSYLDQFQKAILTVLIALMSLVVMLTTLELIYVLAIDILSPPIILLEINELLSIFGFFLLILIGIELLETFRIYLQENVINVQVVFLVAIIAIARKIIILDFDKTQDLTLIGLGFIMISLASAYYLVKKSQDNVSCKKL